MRRCTRGFSTNTEVFGNRCILFRRAPWHLSAVPPANRERLPESCRSLVRPIWHHFEPRQRHVLLSTLVRLMLLVCDTQMSCSDDGRILRVGYQWRKVPRRRRRYRSQRTRARASSHRQDALRAGVEAHARIQLVLPRARRSIGRKDHEVDGWRESLLLQQRC